MTTAGCAGVVRLRRMTIDDLEVVAAIEARAFSSPWPIASYRHELTTVTTAHYFVAYRDAAVARPGQMDTPPEPVVIGYAGLRLQHDEAHVSTLAVVEACRCRGIGATLVARLIERAIDLGAIEVTLEVRASNVAAQRLYAKFGFEVVGHRRRYYPDNDEDAIIMTTPDLADPAWRAHFHALRLRLAS